MPTHREHFAANAHWAALDFENLLNFGEHAAERAELRASGVAQPVIEALYPQAGFVELMPGFIEHLRANAAQIKLGMVALSCPADITGHKVNFDAELAADYEAERKFGEGRLHIGASYGLLYDAFRSGDAYATTDLRNLHLLMWHAWWLQTNRARLNPGAREFADELMLAVAEYELPTIKAPGQPSFAGFHSAASDEIY